MKKSIRIIALAMVAVMLCMALASCGGPSGEYGSEDYSIKFSGSNFVISYKGLVEDKELTGKFEMGKADNGSRTITLTLDEVEGGGFFGDLANAGMKALFDGTKSYNSGKDDNGSYIEIGGLRLYKK